MCRMLSLVGSVVTRLSFGAIPELFICLLVQQFIEQKNQVRNQLGQNSLTAAQLQSCFAVIVIILFPLLEDTATTRHGIAYFAAIIATISGLFLASRHLVRPAFHYLARHKVWNFFPSSARWFYSVFFDTTDFKYSYLNRCLFSRSSAC